MTGPTPPWLSLPERFTLLYHPTRKAPVHVRIGIAGSELAELALLGRISVDAKRIHLLDVTPTGLPWSDALLADLSSAGEPTKLSRWLKTRDSFRHHQQQLTGRGLLLVQNRKVLGLIPRDVHVPAPHVAGMGWHELKGAVRTDHHPNPDVMVLGALVYASHLGRTLNFDRAERAVLKSYGYGNPIVAAVRRIIESQAAAAGAAGASVAATSGGAC